MDLISRKAWDAMAVRGDGYSLIDREPKGVAIHWTGAAGLGEIPHQTPIGLDCFRLVRSIQENAFRRTDAYYVDIEYNFLVCQHRGVFMGRGIGNKPGAQGVENHEYYAVCALLGPHGSSASSDMLEGLVDAIEECQSTSAGIHRAGGIVIAHHSLPGNSTDCPGPQLQAWIAAGARRPSQPAPEPPGQWQSEVTVVPWDDRKLPEASLWGIAAKYLGDGNRWPQIEALNHDLLAPHNGQPQPGMVLHLPPR